VTQLLVSEQSMATLKDAYRMRQFIIGFVGVDQSAARDPHSQSQTINEVTSGSQRRRRRLVAAAGSICRSLATVLPSCVRIDDLAQHSRSLPNLCFRRRFIAEWRPHLILCITGCLSASTSRLHPSHSLWRRCNLWQFVTSNSGND